MSTAELGLSNLQKLHAHARGRIAIMAGCGINENNVAKFKNLQLPAIHGSFRAKQQSKMKFQRNNIQMGMGSENEYTRYVCSAARVRAVKDLMLGNTHTDANAHGQVDVRRGSSEVCQDDIASDDLSIQHVNTRLAGPRSRI